MTAILNWLRWLVIGSEAGGVVTLGQGNQAPATRSGKSPFGGGIERAVAACAALPGDIVEVDEHGAARVVGRRPRVAGEAVDMSEQAILARLGATYGADVSNLVNVAAGENVVVFRKPTHE